MSIAQHHKQSISGWQVVVAVLQSLWGGLFLPDNATACVQVMYGYDCNVEEAVLRLTSIPPLSMACYVVWADIDADHHIVGPKARIIKWLNGGPPDAL